VKWRKYHYTNRTKAEITKLGMDLPLNIFAKLGVNFCLPAQEVAEEMQKYSGLNNNCQHFVTKLYDRLGRGYPTTAGWAPMSSQILPVQMPIVAAMAGNATDNVLSIALSSFCAALTLAQI
jgi:hypothetical protein